jgi:hypothetical protein
MSDKTTSLIKIAEPIVPAPVQAITNAIWHFRQKRISSWWGHFIERPVIDPHDVEDEILTAATSGDERVVQAVMQGAIASADAVDPIVLPAMAMVGRSYAQGRVPAWFHRSAIAYLSECSGEEFGQIRDLLWELKEAAKAAQVEVLINGSQHSCYAIIDVNHQQLPIKAVPNVRRLFSAIKRHNLGFDQGGGMGSPHPVVLIMDPMVMEWLRDAIPPVRRAD